MKTVFFSVLITFSSILTAQAAPKDYQIRRALQRIRLLEMPTTTFDQVIDHFAPATANPATFKQRYWVDSSLAKGPDAPVFYYICGESSCEGASSTPLVNDLARKYGGHRVALEHRYYGDSLPVATFETANLKYLSMDQAIEDLAAFQKYASAQLHLTGKWISVGGSYAGELSAFYRLKHPELVAGALASSAPVLAKADFEEYDRHVANVAGPQCLAAIQAVVADVEEKLKDPTSAKAIKTLFNADDVRDDVDFLYTLADMAAIAIQYGYQAMFCGTLIQGVASGTATETYARVGNKLFRNVGISPFLDSFQSAENTNPKAGSLRAWMYQSCTEFGFYQVAYSNPAQSSRSSQLTLQYHNDVCNRLYGLKTQVNTTKTNQKYYERLFDAGTKNIFFTNGANDPWSNLSITNTPSNPGLKFFVISGAAHCDDLGSRFSAALDQARNQFDTLVKQWLSE